MNKKILFIIYNCVYLYLSTQIHNTLFKSIFVSFCLAAHFTSIIINCSQRVTKEMSYSA